MVGEPDKIEDMIMRPLADSEEFFTAIKAAYKTDTLFRKICSKLEHYSNFKLIEDLLVTTNEKGTRVTCIPRVLYKGRQMNEIILDHGHQVIGHLGTRMMREFLCHYYWWPSMSEEIAKFCESCSRCQMAKMDNR